jgi:two-component sensor histidine kinase
MTDVPNWFQRLPTTGKLLVILSAAILPLGLVLAWAAANGINRANDALVAYAEDQSRAATRSVESLIARNALALRIAGGAALRQSREQPCAYAAQALATSPAVVRNFALRGPDGSLLCTFGDFRQQRVDVLVPPGQILLWIPPGGSALYYRVGVVGGTATGALSREELRDAARQGGGDVESAVLRDRRSELRLIGSGRDRTDRGMEVVNHEHPIGGGQLIAAIGVPIDRVQAADRLIILLPLLMWILAALLSWFLVSRFLIRPLRRMQQAVGSYDPGTSPLVIPDRLGSAVEIRDLGQSFARAVERIEHSEHKMAEALEGQRKLVREVHHRVKNNLQVIASLLNIHGRSAGTPDAREAYSSIGRRVDALAVVHRNHYAELEENRGIALRPLLNELAASLRGSAPDTARGLNIDLDLESVNATQDAAVAIAFLVTEIVEFAMLNRPTDAVELSLHRSGERTARFSVSTAVLNPESANDPDRRQFERIIGGLAKQLRSNLDRSVGQYSVEVPVFLAS